MSFRFMYIAVHSALTIHIFSDIFLSLVDHVIPFLSFSRVSYSGDSLKRFDPRFWLPSLTLVWGIVSIAQGLVTSQAGLFGIRFRKFFFTLSFSDEIPPLKCWA